MNTNTDSDKHFRRMTSFRGIDDIKQIGSTETFLIIIFFFLFLFRFVICEGSTGFEKMNPPKFFETFSQGPARDQPGTKIAINILVRY